MKNRALIGILLLFLSYSSYGQVAVSLNLDEATICSGTQVKLEATASGGTAPYTFRWSSGETSSVIYADKALTYTVFAIDQGGNRSPTKSVIVRAVIKPDAPTVDRQQVVVCRGSGTQLKVTNPLPDAIYRWYADGALLPDIGPILNTAPINQNTLFTVDATVSGCTGAQTPISATLRPNPGVINASICNGSSATLSANGADNYEWYDNSGAIVQNGGATFQTPALTANTSYFVVGITEGCRSDPVEAHVEINPRTQNPNPGGPYEVCLGSRITLTASGVPGAIFEWYDKIDDTEFIIASPDFTTSVLTGDRIYYLQATWHPMVE